MNWIKFGLAALVTTGAGYYGYKLYNNLKKTVKMKDENIKVYEDERSKMFSDIDKLREENDYLSLMVDRLMTEYNEAIDCLGDNDPKGITNHFVEGDRELRYEPNSLDAYLQYIDIKMIDYDPNVTGYELLKNLWTVKYIDIDQLAYRAAENRADFFGDRSTNNQDITWGDVMCHVLEVLQDQLDISADKALFNLLSKHDEYSMEPYKFADLLNKDEFGMFDLLEYNVVFDGDRQTQLNSYIYWYIEKAAEYQIKGDD